MYEYIRSENNVLFSFTVFFLTPRYNTMVSYFPSERAAYKIHSSAPKSSKSDRPLIPQ